MENYAEIGGRGLRLRYTVNSMCAVEELVGGSWEKLLDRPFTAARMLLWGGCIDAMPELTPGEVGQLITEHLRKGGCLEEILRCCSEALERDGFYNHEPEEQP